MAAADRARARLVDALRTAGSASARRRSRRRSGPSRATCSCPTSRRRRPTPTRRWPCSTSTASRPARRRSRRWWRSCSSSSGLRPGHRVLEIGAGTGYNAALMARIVGPAGCGRGGRHRRGAHRGRRSAPGRGRLPRRRADLRGRGTRPSGGSAVRPDRAHRRGSGRPPGLGGAARVRWPVAAAAGGARQPAVGGARPRSGRAAAQRLRAQLRLHPAARDRGGHGRDRPPRGRPARAGARRRSRCPSIPMRSPWPSRIPARSAGRRSR